MKSAKQTCVAGSSTEAEYIALAISIRELIYLKRILQELTQRVQDALTVFEDNTSFMKWTELDTKASRHVVVSYHTAREAVQAREVHVVHCASEVMLADLLTK